MTTDGLQETKRSTIARNSGSKSARNADHTCSSRFISKSEPKNPKIKNNKNFLNSTSEDCGCTNKSQNGARIQGAIAGDPISTVHFESAIKNSRNVIGASSYSGVGNFGSRKVSNSCPNTLEIQRKNEVDFFGGETEKERIGYLARVEKRESVQRALAEYMTQEDYDENNKPSSDQAKILRNLNWCGAPAHSVHLGNYVEDSGRFKRTGFNRCSNFMCPTCNHSKTSQRLNEIISAMDNWKNMGPHNHLLAVTLTVPRDTSANIEDSFVGQKEFFNESLAKFSQHFSKRAKDDLGLITSNTNVEITYGQNGAHFHAHCVWFITDSKYRDRTDFDLSYKLWEIWNEVCTWVATKQKIPFLLEKIKKGDPVIKKPEQFEFYRTIRGKRQKKTGIKGGVTVEKTCKFDAETWAEYLQKTGKSDKTFEEYQKERTDKLAFENTFTASKTSLRYNKENRDRRYTMDDLTSILRLEEKILQSLEGEMLQEARKELFFAKKCVFLNAKHLKGFQMYRWGYMMVDGKKVTAKSVLVEAQSEEKMVFKYEKSSDRITEKEIAQKIDDEIKTGKKKGCGLSLSPESSDFLDDLYSQMTTLRSRKLAIRKDIKKRRESCEFILKIKGRLVNWARNNPDLFDFETEFKGLKEKKIVGSKVYSALQAARHGKSNLYKQYLAGFEKGKTSEERKDDYICTIEQLESKVNSIRDKEKVLSTESKKRTLEPLHQAEVANHSAFAETIEKIKSIHGVHSVKAKRIEEGFAFTYRHLTRIYSVEVVDEKISLVIDWGPPKVLKTYRLLERFLLVEMGVNLKKTSHNVVDPEANIESRTG